MIEEFITCAIQTGGWMEMDRQYLANKIYEWVGIDCDYEADMTGKEMAETLSKKATKDEAVQYMIFLQLLEMLTPPPSVVNACFAERYSQSPEKGTGYYHDLLKGIGFFETSYAKTCEDFLDFYAEGNLVSMNNRFIRMNLSGQSWGFQLLPNKDEEIGMIFPEFEAQYSTLKKVLQKSFEIAEIFPHYEIRTNSGWFDTGRKEAIKSVRETLVSSDFVKVTLCEEENVLTFSSINQEELILCAKKVDFKAYKHLATRKEENAFTLSVHFRTKEYLDEHLLKIKGK